jgi:hypothetical protein
MKLKLAICAKRPDGKPFRAFVWSNSLAIGGARCGEAQGGHKGRPYGRQSLVRACFSACSCLLSRLFRSSGRFAAVLKPNGNLSGGEGGLQICCI